MAFVTAYAWRGVAEIHVQYSHVITLYRSSCRGDDRPFRSGTVKEGPRKPDTNSCWLIIVEIGHACASYEIMIVILQKERPCRLNVESNTVAAVNCLRKG